MIRKLFVLGLCLGVALSGGCSTIKKTFGGGSGGGDYNFSVVGNDVPNAASDMQWRHKYMIEQAHGCMSAKVPGVKMPKGRFVLHFSKPVGRSNGRPELRRDAFGIIYGEAWKDGGTYHVSLPNNGDGYPDQLVHKHECGHLVEFASGIEPHDPRFEGCFRGTYWIRRSGRWLANGLPGQDKPLIKPVDRPELHYRETVRFGDDGELVSVVIGYIPLDG